MARNKIWDKHYKILDPVRSQNTKFSLEDLEYSIEFKRGDLSGGIENALMFLLYVLEQCLQKGMEVVEACTLVMLREGRY